MPKILIAYDTVLGVTEKVATAAAADLGADIERIVEKTDKGGLLGAKHVFVGHMVELIPPKNDPSKYDLVVIASPVRFNSMSLPMRAYITKFKDKFKSVAVLVTGAVSTRATVKDVAYLCGKEPVAKFGVTHACYYSGLYKKKYSEFIKTIKKAKPRAAL